MDKLKSWGVLASLVLTVLGLLLANGLLGSGTAMQVAGWATTILTALGIHVLSPSGTTPAA